MTIGLVGQKIGMTRVFEKDGRSVPVSVIEVKPNVITQVKNLDTDGYSAIQVTTGSKPASRVSKPLTGHFAKAKVEPGLGLWEFHYDASEVANKKNDEEGEGSSGFAVGDQITVELFEQGQVVDVTGTSKGKGFAGAVKRHNFATQDATHGNSLSHRAPGSIGQNQTPGRVFKGKKMAGQLGNKRSTTQNLQVVRVDVERSLLLIKGAIPGAPGTHVVVKPAVKSTAGGAGHAA